MSLPSALFNVIVPPLIVALMPVEADCALIPVAIALAEAAAATFTVVVLPLPATVNVCAPTLFACWALEPPVEDAALMLVVPALVPNEKLPRSEALALAIPTVIV